MSLNIRFFGWRVVKHPTAFEVFEKFEVDVWQTPTDVTLKILDAEDPAAEYIKWIQDTFPSNPDEEGYCPVKYHLEGFALSKRVSEKNGWKLEAEMI